MSIIKKLFMYYVIQMMINHDREGLEISSRLVRRVGSYVSHMIAYFDLKACCDVICKYLVRRLGSYVSHMIAYIGLKI